MDKKVITYLDSAATTSPSDEVVALLIDIFINDLYGNPSSTHNFGIRSKMILETSRQEVADSLGCDVHSVLFTSGATESNNMVFRGICDPYNDSATEIVISAAEHSSVYNVAEAVSTDSGVRLIPLLSDGNLNLEWADRLITEDVSLVSVMLANNETGAIFPIKEIVDLAHSRGALVHCDAVQAYGKIPINVEELGVDFLSISGHKAHALPGIGVLYIRKGVQIHPMIIGGKQEYSRRAGTENYVGIASLGAVADYINEGNYLDSSLRDAFEKGIKNRINDVTINAVKTERVPNISSILFEGVHAAALMSALNSKEVYVSAGPACSSGSLTPSKTLLSMGLTDKEALSTIRFSFSRYSTMEQTAYAIESCVDCVNKLRGNSIKIT